ncbi:MAG: hypothetical protein L0J09_10865, partial [Lactococcus lactis]|nr:hypothetical protein [Lactococcus lactis]
NSYGGGSQNNYSQGGSNTSQNNSNSGSSNQGQGNNGQSNSNSNSNTNTGGNGSNGGNSGQPTHTTKYLGWVSVDGVRKYTKMCDTVAEAQSYVDSTVNSAEVINLGFDHSIGYGLDTVEV